MMDIKLTIIAAVLGALLGLTFKLFFVDRKEIITQNRLFNAIITEIAFIDKNTKDYLDKKSMNDSFGNGQVRKLKKMIYPPWGLLRNVGIDQCITTDKSLNDDIYSYYYNVSMAEKFNEIELNKFYPIYDDEFYTVIRDANTSGNILTKKLDKTISWNKKYLLFLYVPIFLIIVILFLVLTGIL